VSTYNFLKLQGNSINEKTKLIIPINSDGRLKKEDTFYNIMNPNVDLESYAQQYNGLARIQRLSFIAKHCPALRAESLKLAISYVKTTHNTSLYTELERQLCLATSMSRSNGTGKVHGIEVSVEGKEWINTRNKKFAIALERLDSELKNYKSNSIKESIRRGHDDLGDHYLDGGDLTNALKSYSRARDYCTSGR
jgi:COP9 signalosome complex subunit 1